MSAQTDHGVPGGVQADITLESRPFPLLALSAATPGPPAVPVTAALAARESSSASRRAVTRGPRIRGLHGSSIYFLRKLGARASFGIFTAASPDLIVNWLPLPVNTKGTRRQGRISLFNFICLFIFIVKNISVSSSKIKKTQAYEKIPNRIK